MKNKWFESNLSKITRPVAAIKSLRFALFIQENEVENVVCKVVTIFLHRPQCVKVTLSPNFRVSYFGGMYLEVDRLIAMKREQVLIYSDKG